MDGAYNKLIRSVCELCVLFYIPRLEKRHMPASTYSHTRNAHTHTHNAYTHTHNVHTHTRNAHTQARMQTHVHNTRIDKYDFL